MIVHNFQSVFTLITLYDSIIALPCREIFLFLKNLLTSI